MKNIAIFDAFGTIARIANQQHPYRILYRQLPTNLQQLATASLRPLTQTYSFEDYFDAVARLAGSDRSARSIFTPALRSELSAKVKLEVQSIEVIDDALELLRTLRGIGVKIGVCSNLATPYVTPVHALFKDVVDAWCFSCEDGMAKPDAGIYRLMLERLEGDPSDAVMFGDTMLCDVQGPAAVGISGSLVHGAGTQVTLLDAAKKFFPLAGLSGVGGAG